MPPTLSRHRRWPTAVVICTAVAVSVLGGAPQAALAESDRPATGDTVVGELVQAWVEHEAPEPHDDHAAEQAVLTWIDTDAGESVRISTEDLTDIVEELTGDPDAAVPVGATVEVVVGEQVQEGAAAADLEPAHEVLAAEVLEAAPDEPPVTAPAVTITNEVTVVMVVPPNGVAQSDRTLQHVLDAVNGPVAQYWSDQTDGAVRIGTAAVNHDWAPSSVGCSDPGGMWTEAAQRASWIGGPGKHLLVYVPRHSPGCSYGLAQIGSSPGGGGALYVQDTATSLLAHELGHNFGLGHSGARQCDAGSEIGSCRDVDYRDYYDVMGVSGPWVGELNAPHAARLGLIPPGERVEVTAPATSTLHTIAPYGGSTGVRAIRLTDPSGVDYWLEYRTAIRHDAWLGTGMNGYGLEQGVLLRRDRPANRVSLLLDGTPSARSGWDGDWKSALPLGVPVHVAGSAFTVTVESVTSADAQVRVTTVGGDLSCAGRTSTPMNGVALLTAGSSSTALVVGLDRALWLRPIDGTSSSWTTLGGGVLHGPAAVHDGRTSHVFVVGLDGTLFHRADSGSGWSPWRTLGGYLTGSPAAASLGEGQVRVFGRGLDGQLWSRVLDNGSWSGWVPHGGYLTSPPTASADLSANVIEVVVRGLDGYFYAQSLAAGTGTAAYQRRDVTACSALALGAVRGVADPAGGAFVDSRNAPRLLDSSGSRSLGGAITSTPAVAFPGGDVVLVGRGLDNALWLYDGRPGGSGWRSLGGYVL